MRKAADEKSSFWSEIRSSQLNKADKISVAGLKKASRTLSDA
jgi:hypothetical protein